MSGAADRMWSVRDAVLLWLYEEKAKGNQSPSLDLDAIQDAAGWAVDPINADELDSATGYLKDEDYLRGSASFGGGISRPVITSSGENQVASGLSVRPGPPRQADTTGITNNYTINTHAPTNIAMNSSDFTQELTVGEKTRQINAVADAVDRLIETAPPIDLDEAQRVAGELRAAAPQPEQNKNKLKAALGSLIGTVAVAAGTEVGQQVTQLALAAIQSLG